MKNNIMDNKTANLQSKQKRMIDYITASVGLVLIAIGLYLVKSITDPKGVMLAFPYVAIGIGCGTFGHGMGNIIHRKALKGHPEIAKQIAIDQNDERNIAVGNRAKAKAHDMMVFVFGALMLSYALMGVGVLPILLLVGSYLFVIFYGIYYRVKYDKEM